MKGKIQLNKLIIDIIIAILCIGALIGIFIFLKHKRASNEYDENDIGGTIHFIVIYQDNNEVINEYIDFTEGESIYNIISRKHSLVYLDSIGVGKGILEIDEYKSDWYHSYFMLYVNNTYSTEGTEILKAKDNMEIKLVWVQI